jgi:hypothetical protein
MFDPTAFENIKVVVEGEIYDRDLSGEIAVTDRNDWINTAKLSRKYEISFSLAGYEPSSLSATLTIQAGLENLAAELLGSESANQLAGCKVEISFSLIHRNEMSIYHAVQELLENIWGRDRAINQFAQLVPLEKKSLVTNRAIVSFNRLVYEDQIDDLTEMIDYMIASLENLKKLLSE